MRVSSLFRSAVAAAAFSLAVAGGYNSFSVPQSFVARAEAAMVIQRTTIYINTLPKGCIKNEYKYQGGTVVIWKCGTLYYQPYNGRYVRVTIRYT